MISYDDVYKIGTITKTHALKGEVVFNFTDDIFDTTDSDYLIIAVDGILVPFFISEYRFRSDTSALVKFDDIDNADAAQIIIGCDVYFEKAKAQAANEETMSLSYFVGFRMEDEQGNAIGTITDIDDNTENWLFVIQKTDGREALIPAHEQFITHIDHEARVLTMDLPEGLLDL